MKNTLAVVVVLFLFFGVLIAQDSKKDEIAPISGRQTKTNVMQDSAKSEKKFLGRTKVESGSQTTAGKNKKTSTESEPEKGEVFIDNSTPEETPLPQGGSGRETHRTDIPAFFGQLKGVFSEAGKNIMVFENRTGDLTFVQISITKNNEIICRTIGNIYRTMESQ